MIGNMPSAFLVLVASLYFVESMMPGANGTVPASNPCESRIIGECNHRFKSVFARAKRYGRGRKEGSTPEISISDYCEALQIFMDCLAKQSYCRGAWIDDYRYVVLEHGMMDKKCGKCPYHNYGKLEKLLSRDTRPDYVGYDTCSSCASRIHGDCVDRFLEQLAWSDNMCNDIQTFISCYLKEKNRCGDDRIVSHFVSLCDKLGEKMLHADRSHPGLMC